MINSINNNILNSINNYKDKASVTNKNKTSEVKFSNHLTAADKEERKKD